MSLVEMLMSQLGGGNLSSLSKEIGSDEGKTGSAVAAALPMLISALAQNASKPEGAASLHKALEKDHDGSALDQLTGLFSKASTKDEGDGILKHVLGNSRPQVEKGLSSSTGLDSGSSAKLLAMLAPMVLGAIGKAQRQSNMDSNQLAGYLGGEREEVRKVAPRSLGALESLLDADGDGDLDMSDIMSQGAGLLGKLFGR